MMVYISVRVLRVANGEPRDTVCITRASREWRTTEVKNQQLSFIVFCVNRSSCDDWSTCASWRLGSRSYVTSTSFVFTFVWARFLSFTAGSLLRARANFTLYANNNIPRQKFDFYLQDHQKTSLVRTRAQASNHENFLHLAGRRRLDGADGRGQFVAWRQSW